MLEERLEQDLKKALLAGDKVTVATLRTVKSALLYVKVATGSRESGLSDEQVIEVLSKEAKKRQESADLYRQANATDRLEAELAEKKLIEQYLPAQLTEAELSGIINEQAQNFDLGSPQVMGQLIGAVKQATQGAADGATIARLVKEKLQK